MASHESSYQRDLTVYESENNKKVSNIVLIPPKTESIKSRKNFYFDFFRLTDTIHGVVLAGTLRRFRLTP